MLTASYIICTRNRPEDLHHCLDSLVRQAILPDELIVVDASDETLSPAVERAAREAVGDRLPLGFLSAEPGLPRQRNIGTEAARGDVVCFLDDDVILDAAYHREVMRPFSDPHWENVGGVQGTITNRPPTARWVVPLRLLFLMPVDLADGRGRLLPSGNAVYLTAPRDIREVDVLSGCACYRREIVLDLRFDEALSGYAFKEDLDFSWRVGRRYRLLQTPWAQFEHHPSPVSRDQSDRRAQMRLVNNRYLARKNLPPTGRHRLAFAWSQVGEIVWATSYALRRKDPGYIRGALRGLWLATTGRHALLRTAPPQPGGDTR